MDLSLLKNQKFAIFYYAMDETWGKHALHSKMKNLNDLPGKPQDLIDFLISDFSEVDLETLCSKPPKTTEGFVKYICNKIPSKIQITISLNFPPCYIKFDSSSREVLYIFIRLVAESFNPEIPIKWICRGLFNNCLLENDADKPRINAITRIKGSEQWAVLYGKTLYIYNNDLSKKMKEIKAEKIIVDKEQKSVCFMNNKFKSLYMLQPEEDAQIELWDSLVNEEEEKPHIASFLTTINNYYPEALLALVLSMISSYDMRVVRALLEIKLDYETRKKMIQQLFEVFCYTQKVALFMMTLVISDLEKKGITPEMLTDKNSAISIFFNILLQENNQDYNNFLKRVATYASKEYSQRTLFTILKYFVKSPQLLSAKVRTFLSMVRTYTPLVFNEKDVVYNVMKRLILDNIILPKLNECENATCKKVVGVIIKAFDFNLDQYEWSKRLEKHFIPQLYSFIFACGDPCQFPLFDTPTVSNTMSALTSLTKTIATNNAEFQKMMKQFTASTQNYGNSLSYNFASSVASIFKQCFDNDVLNADQQSVSFKLKPVEKDCFNDILREKAYFSRKSCDELQTPDFDNYGYPPASMASETLTSSSDDDDDDVDIENFRKDVFPRVDSIPLLPQCDTCDLPDVQHKQIDHEDIVIDSRDPLDTFMDSTDYVLPQPTTEIPPLIEIDAEPQEAKKGKGKSAKKRKSLKVPPELALAVPKRKKSKK